jgi:hypothetical protein
MGLAGLLLATAVAGQLRLPGRASATTVVLTLRAPDRQRDDVVVTCPVAPDASFRCEVPPGVFDVRIAAPGFLPVYRWGIDVKSLDLGTIPMQRSSSVAGWIVDARHRRAVAGATVALLLPGEKTSAQIAKSNERGFFQFAGVDPGSYAIRATSKGASPAYAHGVIVRELEETLVKDIAIAPLSRLTINITPPVRAPGQEWKIELRRQVPTTPYSRTVARTFGGPVGQAELDGLENGLYFVSIFDSTGTVFAQETLQIDGDPPPLNIHLSLVPIRGSVKAGTAGLKARVEFRSPKGSAVHLQSDEKGDFEGLLPEEGQWNAAVILPTKQEINLKRIDVKRRDTEEFARVDLELPAGRLEGRVVDEHGDGVSTGVRLTRAQTPESAMLSDADGHFLFVGLPKIDAVVDAGNGELTSGPVPVSISEDGAPVTITVRKSRKLQGWITTPAGFPVIGTAIQYWPEADLWGARTTSNPSGLFDLTVPPTARYVDFFVAGAGAPVMLKRLPVPAANERFHLVTAPAPGRLLIRLPRHVPPYPWLSRDGVKASVDGILWPGHIAGLPPQGLTSEGLLFDVDPGQYTVCLKNDCKTVDVTPSSQMKVELEQ